MSASPRLPRDRSSIVMVSEPLWPGGTTIHTHALLLGFRQAGLKPRLATPQAPPPGLFSKADREALGVFPGMLGSLLRPFVFRRLVSWARKAKPSLIHGLSSFTAPVCQRLAQALDLPYVLTVSHYQARGDLRIDARCRKVLACSEPIRENLVNEARIPKEWIQVVPQGVAIPEAPWSSRRQEGQWALVATFAPLTPNQDVATFIRAAAKIHAVRLGACQFLVVGDGPEESALRRLARELKLSKHLVFSHADVPHDRILCDMDVYAQTARREGFGVSILEAVAWGRPVVGTAVGGQIALIKDGHNGYLVPPGDAEAVATKVLDLLGDGKLRARMGAAGRQMAIERFALPKVIGRTVNVYADVLGFGAPHAAAGKTTVAAAPPKV